MHPQTRAEGIANDALTLVIVFTLILEHAAYEWATDLTGV